MVLSDKVLTDKQLRMMLSVGHDHPVVRAMIYLLEVRIQRAMQDLDCRMSKAELTYALGKQDGAFDLLVELKGLTDIGDGERTKV